MPILAAYRNLFFFFFDFVVCRFCTGKQCLGYFRLWSAMRVLVAVLVRDWETKQNKKFWWTSFGRPLEYQNKTCFGKTKSSYQNLFYHRDQTFPNIWPNNSIKNGIYVPPRRVVIPSSPHLFLPCLLWRQRQRQRQLRRRWRRQRWRRQRRQWRRQREWWPMAVATVLSFDVGSGDDNGSDDGGGNGNG